MNLNIIIDSLSLILIIIVFVTTKINENRNRIDGKTLRVLMICVATILCFDIPGWLLDGSTFVGAKTILYIIDTLFWIPQVLYAWLWLMFVIEWNFEKKIVNKNRLLLMIPAIIEIIVIIINLFTGWIFVINENNIYQRGQYYVINMIPYYIYILSSLIISIITTFISKDHDQKRQSFALVFYMALPIIGLINEVFSYGVSWIWPFVTLSILMTYIDVQYKIVTKEAISSAKKETELIDNKAKLMISQIQPHFLYNSLMVIKELCRTDPQLASEVTVKFSDYLRTNMSSLFAKKPVLFIDELEHTKTFLYLELMQYGDCLEINYDIQVKSFLIPALSLQPLVENAVKYGMKKKEHLKIQISTYVYDNDYVIEVTDDGMGFDPNAKKEDGKNHVGISNVRKRLETQCNGELIIDSTLGKGTDVKIIIPKDRFYENNCS